MVALVHFSFVKPLFKCAESTQSRTHCHDLKSIWLVKDFLNSLKLGNNCLEQVATLLVLHQMKLVNDEKLDIKEELLLDQFVEQAVRFLDRADGQIDVGRPGGFRLRVQLDYLKVELLGQSAEILRLLCNDTHVRQNIDCPLAEAKDASQHQNFADYAFTATCGGEVDQICRALPELRAH